MKRKMSDEELLKFYIDLGNDMKDLCNISVGTVVSIGNNFGKTNSFTRRIKKIEKELEKLRSDLENSMPRIITMQLCKERGINPFSIFYGEEKNIKEENE